MKRNYNLIDYFSKEIVRKFLRKKTRENIKNFNQIAVFTNDLMAESIFLYGTPEKEYLEVIKEVLGKYIKNKTVLDIGANVGTHSIFFSSIAKKVYSFEPNKKIFDLLSLNTSNFKNIKIFNYGLSDKSGTFNALIPMDNAGGGSLHLAKGVRNCLEVSFLLKKFMDIRGIDEAEISLIKIDVEGHELNALLGMRKFLTEYSPLILMEQKDGIVNHSSKEIDFLYTLGFKYVYEFKRSDDWLHKKLPRMLPKFLKVFCRIVEILFLGIPSEQLKLERIKLLKKDRYDLLLLAKNEVFH